MDLVTDVFAGAAEAQCEEVVPRAVGAVTSGLHSIAIRGLESIVLSLPEAQWHDWKIGMGYCGSGISHACGDRHELRVICDDGYGE